jgi:RimJ/RimL family protein N-acetyltransferase
VPLNSLTTRRLVLRPPRREDAVAIYDGYARDPEVARYVCWTPHHSIDETHQFLEHFCSHSAEDGYPWVITLAADGTLIGAMHLRVTPPRAEFGFNIAREYWSQGYGTEAATAVVEFGLSLPGIVRLQACCHVDNRASARALEKAGMEREARLRQYMTFPNLSDDAQDVFLYVKTT